MIENALLKLRIIELQKEYFRKKGIDKPDANDVVKMRKAVSMRLKKELKELSNKHIKVTNSVYC